MSIAYLFSAGLCVMFAIWGFEPDWRSGVQAGIALISFGIFIHLNAKENRS